MTQSLPDSQQTPPVATYRQPTELQTGAVAATLSGTVAAAMLTIPKTHPATTTVAELRRVFTDDHIQACLVVSRTLRLLAMLEREDFADDVLDADLALLHGGGLAQRVIGPDAALISAYRAMLATGRRRLAVVDPKGQLLGLLCLKNKRTGFCSDRDVTERAKLPGHRR